MMTSRAQLTRLRAIRQQKALSQEELAEESEVATSTIIRLENLQSGANPKTVRKLAKALGVEPQELVG